MAFVSPPAAVGQGQTAIMAVQEESAEEAAEGAPDGQEVAPLACQRCKRHVATISSLKTTVNQPLTVWYQTEDQMVNICKGSLRRWC
jgi:hypothetical protein